MSQTQNNSNESLQLFEDQAIRTAWDEEKEEWYFSIVDVIAILTESPNPQTYWRVLKKRLKDEGNETVTNCNGLKLKAADGKRRLTDVENTEQLLRIIQSVPSKKAEPFKMSSHFILRWHSSFSERTETIPDTCVYESGTVSVIYINYVRRWRTVFFRYCNCP